MDWLNDFKEVEIDLKAGTMLAPHLYCIGCGKTLGLVCVVVDENMPELKYPDFPFKKDNCPVCNLRGNGNFYTEELNAFFLSEYVDTKVLQQAIMLSRQKG